MTNEQLNDVLECGNAQETWQELVRHLKARAAMARSIAHDCERTAIDAANNAAEHRVDADGFDALATALVNANVDFPKTEAK